MIDEKLRRLARKDYDDLTTQDCIAILRAFPQILEALESAKPKEATLSERETVCLGSRPAPGIPSELFAESANNVEDHIGDANKMVGMPSEEEIARAIFATEHDIEAHLPMVRAVLSLIRPAFDAKEREIQKLIREVVRWSQTAGVVEGWRERALAAEREIEALKKLPVIADYIEVQDHSRAMEARAVAAEANLAQAVEALGPFANYMNDGGDLDAQGKPLPDENGVGWVYLTMGDFRRARAASNIGQKIGQNEGEKG